MYQILLFEISFQFKTVFAMMDGSFQKLPIELNICFQLGTGMQWSVENDKMSSELVGDALS